MDGARVFEREDNMKIPNTKTLGRKYTIAIYSCIVVIFVSIVILMAQYITGLPILEDITVYLRTPLSDCTLKDILYLVLFGVFLNLIFGE